MKVAILFSGGKDSCQAVKWCIDNNHEIVSLITVVPKNTEAYLWHYATVEWTIFSAEALGIPLVLLKCDKIGPKEEAKELEKVLERIEVDALVLGGVGLQKTQISAIREVAKKFKVKVIVPYQNYSSEQLIEEEINSGLDIRITSVASDGLGPEWLGRRLDRKAFEDLRNLSKKFGFDILGEGGYYDTFVTNAPMFKKRIEFFDTEKIWDEKTSSGYLEVKRAELLDK
jgi:predicted ATP pyrophosphatase (TIGR00289 family)